MKYKLILIPILLTFLFCEKNINPLEYQDDNETRIYALSNNQIQPWGDIYCSNYNSIDFKQIKDCHEIRDIYIDNKNNLLICASEHGLYFIDIQNNRKLKELSIPNTENPDFYLGFTDVRIFPCSWSDNYVILCNWSVYLVNLKTMSIETLIWDSWNSEKTIYTRDIQISKDGNSLYLMLDLWGNWVDGNIGRIEIRQRLIELKLLYPNIDIVYSFPREDAPSAKRILNSENYIITFDPNKNLMIRFSTLSKDSIDSFIVDETYNFYSPFTSGNNIIVHDYHTGFFYKINSENKNIELYMDFDFAIPDSQVLSVNYNHYQIMEGGDVYGCFNQLSSGESFIVNLTRKKVLNILQTNGFYNLLLYKKEAVQ